MYLPHSKSGSRLNEPILRELNEMRIEWLSVGLASILVMFNNVSYYYYVLLLLYDKTKIIGQSHSLIYI